MKRAVKFTLLGLLVLLVLVIGSLTFILNDEDFLRRQVESRASASLGRELGIGGLELDLGLLTHVRLQDVRLANTEWGSAPELVHVGDLAATLDFSRWFDTGLELPYFEVADATLNLEENDEGVVNWIVGGGDGAANEDEAETLIPWRRIRISRFELKHRAPGRDVPLEFRIEEFTAGRSPAGRVDLQGNGMIGGYELSVNGFVDPLGALLGGGRVSHELTVRLGENRLESEGAVDDVFTGAGARIDLQFSGPNFEWLLQQAALPEFSSGPFDASLRLDVAEDRSLAVELKGDLGTLQATATGNLDRLVRPSEFVLDFELSGPDLEALGSTLGVERLPARPYRAAGKFNAERGAVDVDRFKAEIGDDTVEFSGHLGPWPGLAGTALDVTAAGTDISAWGPLMGIDGWRPNAFTLKGRFQEQGGMVALGEAVLAVGEGRLTLDGTLGSPPDMMGASVRADLRVPDMSSVLLWQDVAHVPRLPAVLQGSIRRDAAGVHLVEVALAANGHRLTMAGLIALKSKGERVSSEPWPVGLAGSRLTGRLETPNARALSESFSGPALPEETLTAGLVAALDARGLQFEVADGTLGGINFKISARLPRPPGLEGASSTFEITLPSLKVIDSFTATPELPDLPFRVSGSADRLPGGLRLGDVRGSLGSGRFDLDGVVLLEPGMHFRDVRFTASGREFREFFDRDYLEGLPGQFEVSANISEGETARRLEQFTLKLGQSALDVAGTADQLPLPNSYDLGVRLKVPDLAEFKPFLQRFGDYPLPVESLSLDFSLRGDRTELTFTELQASMGRSAAQGQLRWVIGDVPEFHGVIESELLDLSWLWKATGQSEQQQAVSATSADSPPPSRVFGDEPLPVLSIDPMVADVSLRAAQIELPLAQLSNVDFDLKLTERALQLDLNNLEGVGGGRLEGRFWAELGEGELAVGLAGTADNLRLGLASAPDQELTDYPTSDVLVDVRATGGSMHELASSANGRIGLIVGQGRILNSRLDVLFSDILSELFSTLNPFVKRSAYTDLDCAVARVAVSDGVAQVDPLILQTREIVATSAGKIDLGTEKIDLTFNTRPRRGIGISPGMVINPFIKLGGTLAQPAMTLDASGAAVSGGAAFATAGLSLVGKSLYDRFLTERDPCGKVAAELRKMYESEAVDP